MNTLSLAKMPGYSYNEYLVVLSPHEDLRNKIAQLKNEFSDKYKAPAARLGRPHITLANFVQFEMREERLVSRLKTIAMGYHPFKVELKDYGSFPSHTIFINVESKQQVQNLVKEFKAGTAINDIEQRKQTSFYKRASYNPGTQISSMAI